VEGVLATGLLSKMKKKIWDEFDGEVGFMKIATGTIERPS
jgi:hypothetical protein